MNEFNFDTKALEDIQNKKYNNVYMRITSTCNGRVWSLERNDNPKHSRVLSSIAHEASILSGSKSENSYIHGSDLEAFLKRSFSLKIDEDNKGDELLAQNKRAQSFIKAVRRGQLGPVLTRFRRGVKKAAALGRGLEAIERQGKKGKVLNELYWLEALSPNHTFVDQEVHQRYNEWWDSGSKDSFFEWDLSNRPEGAGRQVAYNVEYLGEGFRDRYRVQFQDGKLHRNGVLFDTANQKTGFSGWGSAIFVIGPDGFYSGSHSVGEFHHSSFLSGGAVLGAGEIKTNSEGQIISISNKSGHYKPGKGELINTLKFLQDKAIDLSSIELQEIHPAGEQFEIGVKFIYSSALEYLDSKGNGPLSAIHSSINDKDLNISILKKLYSRGLDLSSVEFRELDSNGNEFNYSALEYLTSNGNCLPAGVSGVEIERDDSGQIISISSKFNDKAFNSYILNEMGIRGLDLRSVEFRELDHTGNEFNYSALEYLTSNGNCLPTGVSGVEIERDDSGQIISISSNRFSKKLNTDMLEILHSKGLVLSSVKFRQRNSQEKYVLYSSALEYLERFLGRNIYPGTFS